MGLKFNDLCSSKRKEEKKFTYRLREGGYMSMEADTGTTYL